MYMFLRVTWNSWFLLQLFNHLWACLLAACFTSLKAVDTIGNCQRLAFTVSVSQHMHKTTNLWKFELNRSSNLRDNNERKKHPCHTKLCVFIWLISRPQVCSKLEVSKSNSWKITSFSKTMLQCFIPSTSPHYS